MRIGYFLSCEEYSPSQLVEQAVLAEQAGFEALWISDHFHPWNDEQGQSPFVWGIIGALSQACHLPVTTAVTAPTVRLHPAIVAQAAATAAVQLEGRFTLGVGTGEALNEHVLGDRWPSVAERRARAANGHRMVAQRRDAGRARCGAAAAEALRTGCVADE
jgi:G6PDH family F420-dependent oxidoreductase